MTSAQAQALIESELELTGTPLTALRAQWPIIWAAYANEVATDHLLRYLKAKRHAVVWLQGQHWQDVAAQDAGVSLQEQQMVANLDTILRATDAQIDRIERRARANRAPVTGAISDPTVGTSFVG